MYTSRVSSRAQRWEQRSIRAQAEQATLAPTPTRQDSASVGASRYAAWDAIPLALKFHAWPIALLAIATAFIFREPLFYGYRFIGNSDRYNQYLTFLEYHARNIAAGNFSAWSEHMLGGFDTLSLAFSFPSPLFLPAVLLRSADLISLSAYVDAGLMLTTLVLTYFVLYHVTGDRMASVAGACIYALATYPLLKLAQNDGTYLSVLFAPVMFHLVYTADRARLARSIVALALITAFCIYCAFLQEFSYIVLFLLAYGVWRFGRGSRGPLMAVTGGLAAGVILALPRLLAIYQSIASTLRLAGFNEKEYVGPATLFRFFSRDIFGRSFAENLQGSNLNLYEGDLLFVSVFASLLLLIILVGLTQGCARARGIDRKDALFLLGYVVFVFGTMHVPLIYNLVTRLYANVSFPHTRIDVSALFPIALLSALFLTRVNRRRPPVAAVGVTAGFTLAVLVASTYDYSGLAGFVGLGSRPFIECQACQLDGQPVDLLSVDVLRFAVIASLFALLLVAPRVLPWFNSDALRATLAVCIVLQAVWGAWVWLSGPATQQYTTPYEGNDLVMAPPGQFAVPDAAQTAALQDLVDNDAYRSITICPRSVIKVDCSPIVGLLWRIRLADGYLSGVTRRYAALPWEPRPGVTAIDLHDIRFDSLDQVPWKLMALLNVKSAIVVDGKLYSNTSFSPATVQVVKNPSPYVYPRAYFSGGVYPVTEFQDASAIVRQFGACEGCDNLLDEPSPVDYVEGPVFGQFDASGSPTVSGSGDRLDVTFPASTQPRFLVLNEGYAPGWTANSDGQALAVFATNVVMRGVVVPAGATHVQFVYHSFIEGAVWYTLGLIFVAGVVGAMYLRYVSRSPKLLAPLG
jgi:hypothetical protein